jgi:hypothetical protein
MQERRAGPYGQCSVEAHPARPEPVEGRARCSWSGEFTTSGTGGFDLLTTLYDRAKNSRTCCTRGAVS